MSSLAGSIATEAFRSALATLQGLDVPFAPAPPPLRLALPPAGPHAHVPAGPLVRTAGAQAPGRIRALSSQPTAVQARRLLDDGEVSTRELLERSLEAAAAVADLGAVVALDEAEARREADALDAELARGLPRGPLHGIPLTVKDVIDVAGLPTGAGSRAYDDLPAADAASVALLRAAGALVLAKVATHEFALGVTTPQCANPFDPTRISGGSSGGSAIAVSTGIGIASLGTDTRASLRVPSSLCGTVGFKPTFGRVPTAGVVPLAWTVDHVGPIARTVEDAALLLAVLTGDGSIAAAPRPGGTVVGIAGATLEDVDPEVAAAFHAALDVLADLGCELVSVDCPSADDLELANALGLVVSRAEAAAFHRSRGTDLDLCIPEVRAQLLAGLEVTAVDYLDGQRQRELLARRLVSAFSACDVLAMPATTCTAPPRDDYEGYLMRLSRNAIPWSLAGVPALAMPCGADADGLPIGLQLVGPAFGEPTLAGLGTALERALAA